MWPFRRKPPQLATTLSVGHEANYLNVPADPCVIYHPTFGQVVVLLPAPAPERITYEELFVDGIKLFDLAELGVIPSYYYKREDMAQVYVR